MVCIGLGCCTQATCGIHAVPSPLHSTMHTVPRTLIKGPCNRAVASYRGYFFNYVAGRRAGNTGVVTYFVMCTQSVTLKTMQIIAQILLWKQSSFDCRPGQAIINGKQDGFVVYVARPKDAVVHISLYVRERKTFFFLSFFLHSADGNEW